MKQQFKKSLVALAVSAVMTHGALADNFGFETGSATGWTSSTLTTVGTTSIQAGSNNWTINPYGSYMGQLQIQQGSYSAMATALGLTSTSTTAIQTMLTTQAQTSGGNPNPTTAGWVTQQVTLTAGTQFTMAWQYVSIDYVPFNDGSIATLTQTGTNTATVNNYQQQYALLGFTNPGTGDYSTGSYGATGWQVATFDVSVSGTYTLGFGVFNMGDTSLSPVLFIDEVQGTTLKNGTTFGAVAPNNSTAPAAPSSGGSGGGSSTPAPTATVNTGTTAGTDTLATAVTVNGGTIQLAATGITLTNTFTVDSNGMTIDQNGKTSTFNGVISGTGAVTIANTGTGGGVTFAATNTYTGATIINSGATFANTGNNTASSGTTNAGTFTNDGTTGNVTNSNLFTNNSTAGNITNTGGFTNNAGATVGTVNNSNTTVNSGTTGDVTNTGTFANNSTGVTGNVTNSNAFLNSGTTSTVTNNANATFTNNATGITSDVNNAGTFLNSGTTGSVTNDTGGTFNNTTTGTTGDVTNASTFNNSGTTGTITNNGGVVTTSGTTGNITNMNGTVSNSGIVGAVTNWISGIFTNSGTTGSVSNIGAFTNNGTTSGVTNTGTFTNAGTTGDVTNSNLFTNSGAVGTVTNTGTFTQTGGTSTLINNAGTGTVNLSGGTADIVNAGTVNQTGGSAGTVTNNGTYTVSGGNVGSITNNNTLYVNGPLTVNNYTQTSSGSTVLYWTSAGVQQLTATGTASLAGNLQLNQQAGTEFRPSYGQHGILTAGTVTGKYDTLTLSPDNVSPLGYGLVYTGNSVSLKVTPSADYTMAAVNTTANNLANITNLQAGSLGGTLNYDCNLFGENNMCISTGVRTTSDNAGSISGGNFIIGKRVNGNWRVGLFADQAVGSTTAGNVKLSLGPALGGFVNWNEDARGYGWGVQTSAAFSSGNLDINRTGSAYSESATGKTTATGQAFQIKTTYATPVTSRDTVTPYAGIRYTSITNNGYTEQGAVYPITYGSVTQSATDALAGISLSHNFGRTTASISSGVIQNISYSAGTLTGSSEIIGLNSINTKLPGSGYTSLSLGAGLSYDLAKNQYIGASVGWQQKSLLNTSILSGAVTYTIGF